MTEDKFTSFLSDWRGRDSLLTCPVLPHSGRPRSSRPLPWTSASAGSANRPLSGWRAGLRHQTANPGRDREGGGGGSGYLSHRKTKNKRSVNVKTSWRGNAAGVGVGGEGGRDFLFSLVTWCDNAHFKKWILWWQKELLQRKKCLETKATSSPVEQMNQHINCCH